MDFLKDMLTSLGADKVPVEVKPGGKKTEKIVQAVNNLFDNPEKIVRTPNEPAPPVVNGPQDLQLQVLEPHPLLCACGHPIDAHEDCGPCGILECDCDTFTQVDDEESMSEAEFGQLMQEKLGDVGSAAQIGEQLPAPSLDNTDFPDDHCHHLCDNPDCLKWWTHGLKSECKYPDILRQGLCQACNKGGETFQIKPEEDYNNKDGKITLTPAAQIRVRNDETFICKDMSIEQLTNHIQFHALRIEELRIRSLQARKLRSELEEALLSSIPEHEREKFIQELRQGKKKKSSKAKASKPKLESNATKIAALKSQLTAQGKSNQEAQAIAAMMVKTGKTQAQVEAWLND